MVAVSELARSRAEAHAEGKKFYFTGKPCVRGHIAIRYACGGCIECVKDSSKQWHTDNPEKVKAKDARWRERHPDKTRAKNTTERKRLTNARWQASNPEKRRVIMTRWRAENRNKARAATADWQRRNPDRVRYYVRKRRAIKNGADGHCTPEQIESLKKKTKGICWACGHKRRLTIDHIVPLSKGGSNSINNIQFLCKPCNSAKRDKDPEDFARSLGRLL